MSEVVPNPPNLTGCQVGVSLPDAIGLRLTADNGSTFTVRVNRATVAHLILEMTARVSSLADQPDAPAIQVPLLSAIGADIAVGPRGEPGLSIRLAGGLRLTLALNAVAIANLQEHLAKLAQVRAPDGGSSH
jgi:hypothetical protein